MDIADNVSLSGCGWTTVSLPREQVDAIALSAREGHPGAAVVVSCQRIEAYGIGHCDCAARNRWEGHPALTHLAEVAVGLHSVVLGEDQILGQVRAAFAGTAGELRAMGEVAVASARELRRETSFDSHAGHLLDRALRLTGLPARGSLLVLGTGAMGRLVAQRAHEIGFGAVIVAGRTPPRSGASRSWTFVPLTRVADLPPVDVAVGCLGSCAPVVPVESLPPVRRLILDLGTPLNFSGQPQVPLVSIADLLADEQSRPHAVRRRTELRRRLTAIVDRRLAERATTDATPIGRLRLEVERVRRRELERMKRLHPEVAPETLEVLTRSLVNQIFHAPSERLKTLDDDALGQRLVALFAEPAPSR